MLKLKYLLPTLLAFGVEVATASLEKDLRTQGTNFVCHRDYYLDNLLKVEIDYNVKTLHGSFLFIFPTRSNIEYIFDVRFLAKKEDFTDYKKHCPLEFDFEDLKPVLAGLEEKILNGDFRTYHLEEGEWIYHTNSSEPIDFMESSKARLKMDVESYVLQMLGATSEP